MARASNKHLQWCKESGLTERLWRAREFAGMTKTEAIDVIGCDKKTIYDCENGYAVPQVEFLYEVAKAYGISLDWLFGLSDKIVRYDKLNVDLDGTVASCKKIEETMKQLQWIISRAR